MKTYADLISLIADIVKYIAIPYGILGFAITKLKKKYLVIPIYIISAILLFHVGHYAILLDIFLPFITICLLYDTSMKSALKGFLIEYVLLLLMEMTVWLSVVGLTPLGSDVAKNVQRIIVTADIAGMLLWIVLSVFFMKFRKVIHARLVSLKGREIIVIIIGLGSFSVTVSFIPGIFPGEFVGGIQKVGMIASIVTSVFVIIILGLAVYLLETREKLQKINALDEECIKYQKDYYEGIIKFDEEMRAFRHDVNKHYRVINELINRGEYAETQRYIKTLTEIKDCEYVYRTGNLIADYIINGKIAEMSEIMDIDIEVVGRFPNSIKIENTDLCIIIENALDNAKEALLKFSGNKILEIIIRNYKQGLYLTFINSSEKVDIHHLYTSKRDKINHGYGMNNIERVVGKYKGTIDKRYDSEKFYLYIEI